MTKREEAEQAMRLGDEPARDDYRVRLLREAINEALEEAAVIVWGHEPDGRLAAMVRALKKEA